MANDIFQNRKVDIIANPNSFVTSGQSYIGVTSTSSGDREILLSQEDVSNPGFRIEIKDESGSITGNSNGIKIKTQGSATIDGRNEWSISVPYGSRTFTSNGTDWFQDIGLTTGSIINISTTTTQLAPATGTFQNVSFSDIDVNTASDRIQWLSTTDEFIFNYPFEYQYEFTVSVSRLAPTSGESIQFAFAISGTFIGEPQIIEMITDQSIIQRKFVYRARVQNGEDAAFVMAPLFKMPSSTLGLYPALKANPALPDFVSASCEIFNLG